jgi:hypothetical protein
VRPEPFFRCLAYGLLVREFTGAFLLADWSIGGWKSLGRRERWHMTKLLHRAGLDDLFGRVEMARAAGPRPKLRCLSPARNRTPHLGWHLVYGLHNAVDVSLRDEFGPIAPAIYRKLPQPLWIITIVGEPLSFCCSAFHRLHAAVSLVMKSPQSEYWRSPRSNASRTTSG